MDALIAERLEGLRVERMKGERQLESVDRERQETRDTLLRISGAIQVLEELLSSRVEEKAALPVE